MQSYLFETHAHTAEVSPCADMRAADVVEAYRKLHYHGIVITDHMHDHLHFPALSHSWRKKADYFLRGYRAAKDAAAGHDFTVLLGMEIRFQDSINDYLLFGVTEDFVYQNPYLYRIPCLRDFLPLARKHELLIFQAHPFRIGMQVSDPALLDGMEVYNGNPGHNSSNDAAVFWAKKYDLLPSSGSDFHGQAGQWGGLCFSQPVKRNADLLRQLRARSYQLQGDFPE